VTKDVIDPETKMPVWKRERLVAASRATPEARAEVRSRADTRLPALGSGSDYTAFLHHLGIASLNIGYGGEDQGGGQYHSVYDDFYWYTHFSDTDFSYGKALAETGGTMMMRLADADIIPFQFGDLADTIHGYVGEVKKLTDTMRAQSKERNAEIADGTYAALADPQKKRVVPPVEPLAPYLNFAPLDQASDDLTAAAAEYDKAFAAHGASGVTAVNPELIQTERVFLDPGGLPNRPWFENMMYAPGFYTGYGVKTLPAIRETIEQKDWTAVDPQIARTAAAVEREAMLLKEAAKTLNGAQ
jgi:N-acetylated-alpha-linked acidic dipeptidase